MLTTCIFVLQQLQPSPVIYTVLPEMTKCWHLTSWQPNVILFCIKFFNNCWDKLNSIYLNSDFWHLNKQTSLSQTRFLQAQITDEGTYPQCHPTLQVQTGNVVERRHKASQQPNWKVNAKHWMSFITRRLCNKVSQEWELNILLLPLPQYQSCGYKYIHPGKT